MNHPITKGMEYVYFLLPVLNLLCTVALVMALKRGKFPLFSWGKKLFGLDKKDVELMDEERTNKLHIYLWLGGLMGIISSFFIGYGMVVVVPNTYLYMTLTLGIQIAAILFFWIRRGEDMGKLK